MNVFSWASILLVEVLNQFCCEQLVVRFVMQVMLGQMESNQTPRLFISTEALDSIPCASRELLSIPVNMNNSLNSTDVVDVFCVSLLVKN